MSDICNDYYKAPMGATGEDTKLQGFTAFPGAQLELGTMFHMPVIPKVIYRVKAMPRDSPIFFTEPEQPLLKCLEQRNKS